MNGDGDFGYDYGYDNGGGGYDPYYDPFDGGFGGGGGGDADLSSILDLSDITLPSTGIEQQPIPLSDMSFFLGTGVEQNPPLLTVPDNWDSFWAETASQLDSQAVESAYAAQQAGKNPSDWLTAQQTLEIAGAPPSDQSFWSKVGNALGVSGASGGSSGGGLPTGGAAATQPKPAASSTASLLTIGLIGIGALMFLKK